MKIISYLKNKQTSWTITVTGVRVDDAAKRLDERKKRINIEKVCTIHWLYKRNKQYSNR